MTCNKKLILFMSCLNYPALGASIYDVRAKGGRGVSGKADEGRELSKGGCVNLRTRGGEGVKKSENFADVINGSSLTLLAAGRSSVAK